VTTAIIIAIIDIIIIIIAKLRCALQKAQDSYLQAKASISPTFLVYGPNTVNNFYAVTYK